MLHVQAAMSVLDNEPDAVRRHQQLAALRQRKAKLDDEVGRARRGGMG